ncbi:MAG: tetratricopeptide repeat protein [Streptosporangiales bacterium]|nr:tetratricopeptide repeat protein [Streptosporangiales bacterium]
MDSSGPDGQQPRDAVEERRETAPGPRNEMSGTAGPVVQAHAIYGDVRIGGGTAERSQPKPRQLPAAPVNFTGRAGELAELERLAAGTETVKGPAIVVIVGPGGLGKTSLAAHWLSRASTRYPDGVLSADLGGHQLDGVVPPGDVLDGFLRLLGVPPDSIPRTLHERAALFRSLTDGRRTAVFLDNAASAAQVRTLLPGPGPEPGTSLALVTTRRRIAGLAVDGARFLELRSLEEVAAADLLGRVAGAERTAAEEDASREVVRLCGGVPLALCVAGARLAAHPNWPVSRIARDLADGQARLSALSLDGDLSVRATFDASCQTLPIAVARAYRATALIPGPDFPADLAIAALDDARGQDLLDALTDASLLEESPVGRYRMHDLVRLHAREQEVPDLPGGAEGVIRRSVNWYLHKAVAADRVILPGRWRLGPLYAEESDQPSEYGGPPDALAWVESHMPGLVAAVRAARDAGLHPEAWQLCEGLWGTLLSRKRYEAWFASHAVGLESAQACGDCLGEAQMHIQLGAAHRSVRALDAAARHFIQAMELFREEGHRLGEASALDHLGVVRLRQGAYDEAINGFTAALAVHQAIGRPRGVALMNFNIGQTLAASGRPEAAVGHFRSATGQFEAIGELYHQARALTALGEVLARLGRPQEAEVPLGAAVEIAKSIGATYDQARAHVQVANLAAALGQRSRSCGHLEQALALYTEVGAPQADEVRARLAG